MTSPSACSLSSRASPTWTRARRSAPDAPRMIATGSRPTPALATRVALDLARRAEALDDARHRVVERAGGEAIHDLRVSSRRLGEALRAWRDALPRRDARALFRRVERLRRAAGDARDAEGRSDPLRAAVR